MTSHYRAKLPIKIVSEANQRDHWSARARRFKAHKQASLALTVTIPFPLTITLTRIGPRTLDTDNLAGGFKGLRDGIAARLKVDDADPRITWVYAQQKGAPKEYAAIVEVVPRAC